MKYLIMGMAALLLVSCSSSSSGDGGGDNGTNTGQNCVPKDMPVVEFQEVDQAVFASSCTRCHGGPGGAGGVDTSTFAGVKANLSNIFNAIETGRMPRGGPPVSADNVNLVAAWINIGAPQTVNDIDFCE